MVGDEGESTSYGRLRCAWQKRLGRRVADSGRVRSSIILSAGTQIGQRIRQATREKYGRL